MCGIGGKSTLSRVLEELQGHGLIEVGRPQDRRKSNRYILNYVTIPEHVIERTLKAVERASQPVETPAVRGPETGQLRSPKTGHESLQCNPIKKEREREGRGRLDPPPRSSGKTFASHPLSRSFEDKSTPPLAKPVECVEPTEEARREWAKAKLAGPVATMPDHRPWLKAGMTRRQWLRTKRSKDLFTTTRKAG